VIIICTLAAKIATLIVVDDACLIGPAQRAAKSTTYILSGRIAAQKRTVYS
jgi:hypothetical protein